MKADATKTKRSTKTTATKRKRSTTTSKQERGIPFEEMKRLMDTYGSTKCLRKRQQKPSPPSKDGKDEAAQSRTKIDSIKRKFYRWFPDLDERFVRNVETGTYVPKIGHENELKYRQDMRLKDGQILSKKRAKCRKERNGNNSSSSSSTANTSARRVTTGTAPQGRWASSKTSTGGNAMMINSFYNMPNINKAAANIITPSSSTVSDTSTTRRVSPVVDPRIMSKSMPTPSYAPLPIISASSLPPLPSINTKSNMNIADCDEDNDYFTSSMNFGDVPLPQMTTSSSSTPYNNNDNNDDDDLQSITSDEPVDQSFTAKSGIFDDVEQDFFGLVESRHHPLVVEECAASKVSSSSSSLEGGGCDELKRSSSNSTIDDINDMLEKSIEECCEEIFSGDEKERSVSGSGYIFDMIST